MKRLGVVVAILGIALVAFFMPRLGGVAATPGMFDRNMTLAMATEQSDATGKPVLAFVTADWCGPCQKMKRTTMVDAEVESLIRQSMIPVYVDADNDRPDAVEIGNVRFLPTSVVRLGDQEVSRIEGGKNAREYLAWLRGSLEEVERRTAMPTDE